VSLLLLTILLTASIAEAPTLELPRPPVTQPADMDLVEVHVGMMRKALYYYEIVPILTAYSNELSAYALEQAAIADTERVERIRAEFDVTKYKGQRNTALITSSVVVIIAGLIVIYQ